MGQSSWGRGGQLEQEAAVPRRGRVGCAGGIGRTRHCATGGGGCRRGGRGIGSVGRDPGQVHFNRQGLSLGARLTQPGGQGLGAHGFELDRDKLALQAQLQARTCRGAEALQGAHGLVARQDLAAPVKGHVGDPDGG